jgi:cystathionine beta-lyase/cystathionine gamma-synthase
MGISNLIYNMGAKKMMYKSNCYKSWFNADWIRFKETHLMTPGVNFEPDAIKYKALLMKSGPKCFGLGINHPFPYVGYFGEFLRGEIKGDAYFRYGGTSIDALEERLLLAEAGYLMDKGINPAEYLDAAVVPAGMCAISMVALTMASLLPVDTPKGREKRAGMQFMRGEVVYPATKRALDEMVCSIACMSPAIAVDTTDEKGVNNVYTTLDSIGARILALHLEPVTNPEIEHTNIRRIYQEVNDSLNHTPIVADNTFLTPYLQQPLRMGADIIVHSLTKYASDGKMVAGAVIGPKPFVQTLKKWRGVIPGCMQTPQLAIELYELLSDMPDRIETQSRYAKEIAEYLRSVPEYVETVHYPDLGNLTREGLAGGVLSFELAGTPEQKTAREIALTNEVIAHPSIAKYAVSLGHEEHLFFGESTYGLPNNNPPGFVRYAVGRNPDAKAMIKFLDEKFRQVCK